MQFSFTEIFQHMGVPAMVVATVLVIMGLASLTVFIERIMTLRRSRAVSRAFAAAAGAHMDAGDFDAALAEAEKHERGHLPRVVRSALTTYRHAEETADVTGLTPVERTVRHMERYMQEIGTDLRRGLAVLATVGSVAPFVGLLGTVLGIITAFQGIASTGSGGLSGVSAGISEALIETALGLAVAIPAVLAFNYLSGQIAQDELMLNHASGQLLDLLEDWAERLVAKRGQGGSSPVSTSTRSERADRHPVGAAASVPGVA
ncbi:MAG TPA: MotA/TolQ/ExbB proton channel family protein [Candidatus Kryptonia bacterium]|nr:MotA/TolQ/ExbB proton channel family protein [Candidatus Kryptonia bacterium]